MSLALPAGASVAGFGTSVGDTNAGGSDTGTEGSSTAAAIGPQEM
jgi:hypothetical protein